VQQQAVKEGMHTKYPLILTSGRLVEYEGRRRGDALQPVARRAAAGQHRRDQPEDRRRSQLRAGEYVWVSTPTGARIKVKAKITEASGADTVFIPFHFSGCGRARTCCPTTPRVPRPIVRGEAVNTATTYGYDRVTMMQETKTTLCQVAKA